MENIIHSIHSVSNRSRIPDVPYVEFYFSSNIRMLSLQVMAHIILFFSSLEKILICPISVFKKCFKTVFPKDPVPPVIKRILPSKLLINISPYHQLLPLCSSTYCFSHIYYNKLTNDNCSNVDKCNQIS